MTLVKFYAPNGVMLSEILHSCFCSHYNKTDVEVQQAKDKRFKPSLGVEEE